VTTRRAKIPEIFLCEDNPPDVLLFQKGLRKWSIHCNLTVCDNGTQAVGRLISEIEEPYIPDLIVLDQNMPGLKGTEILIDLKSHPKLKLVPTIMFSGSSSSREIMDAYGFHANAFVQKPTNVIRYLEVVKAMEYWWFDIVHLPDGKPLRENY
jgi:two-component system, chemotaxis family, response regulator Rcp1